MQLTKLRGAPCHFKAGGILFVSESITFGWSTGRLLLLGPAHRRWVPLMLYVPLTVVWAIFEVVSIGGVVVSCCQVPLLLVINKNEPELPSPIKVT